VSAFILTVLLAVLPPCAAEDSRNCHWDAQARSNGLGHSFIDMAGEVFYL
jgi:hypothetical protein